MTATKALVAHEPSGGQANFRLENVTLRDLKDTEVLVRIVATGICHTDLVFASLPKQAGSYPKVLGHEGAGTVEKIGNAVLNLRPGDQVLLSFSFCSNCHSCREKHPSYCQRFSEINYLTEPGVFESLEGSNPSGLFFGQSSFSNFAIVQQSSVVNVSGLAISEQELKLFAPLGCGFQTGIGTVENLAQAKEQDIVVILGLGGVGLSSVMGANLKGCNTIIAVDRVQHRLDLALVLGATHRINISDLEISLTEAVKTATNGVGASITIDTTGNMDVIASGMEFTANRGQMIILGAPPMEAQLSVHLVSFMQTGKILRGSIEGDVIPSTYIPKMIQWYREGNFPIDRLVKFYPVQDFELALAEMKNGTAIKPILIW